MSYSTNNPPRQIVPSGLAGGSGALWLYASTDAHGTVSGAGYFTDGSAHGMKVGDVVIVQKSDTGATTLHSVVSIAAQVGVGLVAQHAARAVTISAAVLA